MKTVTEIIFIICRIKNSDKFFKKCIKIYIFSPFVLISGGDFMTNFFMVPNEVFDLNLKPPDLVMIFLLQRNFMLSLTVLSEIAQASAMVCMDG